MNTLDKGGRTKHVVEESVGLRSLGHTVWLASFEEPPQWVAKQFGKDANWLCIHKKNHGIDFLLIGKLWRLIRNKKIDVIHCHCEASSLYGGLAGKLRGIKSVTTFHRSDLSYYTKHWRNKCYFAFVNGFIAISNERKQRMLSNLGFAHRSVDLLHWGINTSQIQSLKTAEYYREKLGVNGKVILSIGHLGTIKGHEDSIKAIAQLLTRHPEAHLFIAGNGTKQDYKRLKQLIENLNLSQHITLLGQITQPLEWMKACDIFLQPSREEGFGLVFLEAGACEKPSVATQLGGIPDIVLHEKTGLLVEPKQPSQIANALDKLLSDHEKRAEYGIQAYRRVTEHFDLTQKIIELESILKRYHYD